MTLKNRRALSLSAVACLLVVGCVMPPYDTTPIHQATIVHVDGKDQIAVDARAGWVKTGLTVRSGEKIHFSANGSWGESPGENRTADGGQAGLFGSGYWGVERPLGYAPWGALVGRVGSNVFLIGADNVVTIPQDGELMLGINDGQGQFLNDNHGYVTVTISPQ